MKYFFIGIKGSGMSALAQVLYGLGYKVTGSDKSEHFFTENALLEKGIKIHRFNKNNIKKRMIVIKGNAFGDDHEEVVRAKELGLKIYTYQEMIAELTNNTKLIAISGCHGKTTTTTMMSKVFENAGINYLIGDGSGYADPKNKYFALEACEWKRHFLEYSPYYAVVTNIELDHTDYYKDLDDVIDAFNSFVNKARYAVVMCGDDENVRKLKPKKKTLYYGFKTTNDVYIKDIEIYNGKTYASVYIDGIYFDNYVFPFVGDHLLLNALAVITVCYLEHIPQDEIRNQIPMIEHAKRRFIEEKAGDNIIIDDYAHHPTEVRVTIEAARKKYPGKQIIAIFKAHTKSRVKAFSQEFADALNLADKCYIMDIGEDRKETGYDDVTCYDIINKTRNGEKITNMGARKLLKYHDSVLVFMSSKDIYILEEKYKKMVKYY